MKKSQLIIAAGLMLASISTRADVANYQSTVSGQTPGYYFHFDNSLVDSVGGTAAFTANGSATFGSDYSANANDAALFPVVTDYLSLASPTIISGENTSTAVGSLSLLFYLPSTVPNTAYLFSDSETTGSEFAFDISGGNTFQLKIGNLTSSLSGTPTITLATWYYLSVTYNLNGTATGVNGVNWYLGVPGGSLSSGFIQKGGTGNINTTSTLGNGGTFDLGNRLLHNNSFGAGSEIDELATWNTALSSSQIQAQFSAVTVPEPSTWAMVSIGMLTLLRFRRKVGANRQG
jgi:hypothetical protein